MTCWISREGIFCFSINGFLLEIIWMDDFDIIGSFSWSFWLLAKFGTDSNWQNEYLKKSVFVFRSDFAGLRKVGWIFSAVQVVFLVQFRTDFDFWWRFWWVLMSFGKIWWKEWWEMFWNWCRNGFMHFYNFDRIWCVKS